MATMKQTANNWAADASELDWLRQRLTNSAGDGVHVVSEVVPAGFDSYVRVFHSWFAEDDEDQRSTWRERAALCNVPYTGDMTARAIERSLGPPLSPETWLIEEGEPDSRTRAGLVNLLAKATGDQSVFFSYELSAEVSADGGPIVLRTGLSELESIRTWLASAYPGLVGPEHWWPDDRRWVVGSDYDLHSTYVACSEETGRLLLAGDSLETLPVTPQTRVDEKHR
jgi:hypothetical protein